MGHLGVLLFLLGGLGTLADICEIPEVDSKLVETLGQRLLPWIDWLSLEHLNPSIYVGLRLSSLQAGAREAFYLHILKLKYQQSFLSPRLAVNDDKRDDQAKPSMGQLALYLLALRANCEFVGGHKGDRLVSQLKRFLENEKRAIGPNHKGHPHTSYYQYGLGILALCVHQKRLHDTVVGKLLYAVEHDQHIHRDHLSVDTVAMAGLAFTCLDHSNFNPNQRHRITLAIRTVQEKILKAQTAEGYFGNVYSTPLALQLLMNSFMPGEKLGRACLKARTALLASMKNGAFRNALLISQLLPVLNGKSYVDLISPDCEAPRVLLQLAMEYPSQTREVISVMLKVPSVMPPYRYSISVPAGSSLEDVFKKAQKLGGFTYGTQNTLSGPYLTSVMGKEVGEREFWQLLRAPDTPLLEGALLQEERLDAVTLLYATSLPSFCLLAGAALVLEAGVAPPPTPTNSHLWACILLSCLLSVLYNLASFSLLALTSALTVHVLGNLTVVGNLVLSRLLFGSRLSALSYVGIALTLSGMFLYHNCEFVASWAARWHPWRRDQTGKGL